MKQLVCEMCGSTDLIKQDGVFVCQSCGCKYSVEEAKKMMVEGTVDVTGSTVKVDNTAELTNLYQLARRAKNEENSENAAKYYNMILMKDPSSWEAAFYAIYYTALNCKIAQIRSAAISVRNCERGVLLLIREHVPREEQADAVSEVLERSKRIASMLFSGAKRHYDGISADIRSNYKDEFVENSSAARDILYSCGVQIDQVFGEQRDIARYAADALKAGIALHKELLPNLQDKEKNEDIMAGYARIIGKYDQIYAKQYEIARLQKIIATTPTEQKRSSTAVFALVAGVFILFLGAILTFGLGGWSSGWWTYPVGGFFVFIGVVGKPSEEEIEKNRKTVADAREELERLMQDPQS